MGRAQVVGLGPGAGAFHVRVSTGLPDADPSVGFRNDITVVRAVGGFGFGFLYPSAVARISDEA